MEGAPKFLNEEEKRIESLNWQDSAIKQERNRVYKFNRTELGNDVYGHENISDLHGISFIDDVIPGLIAKKKGRGKVKILDIGAGACFFTDQLREKFGDKVDVFSTGLSKKAAGEYRKKHKTEGDNKLHRNDLKWRSILELSDFEEFDLIVDTIGEFFYSVMSPHEDRRQEVATKYLISVIKKLNPGGMASIRGGSVRSLMHFTQDLEREYNVRIYSPVSSVLRIEKPDLV